MDDGQGGVRRVAEGMQDALPKFGIELTRTPEEADLIATHIQIPTGWDIRFAHVPIVEHCHGLYWEEMEWPKWAHEANHLVLDAIKASDLSTAPTQWVAQTIRRHTGRDVRVVPHGIDFENWDADAEKLGYVYWDKTRPDPVCDPAHMNSLAELLPEVSFISTFGKQAANVRITDKVSYLEAKKTMEQASVYLCTARETFGVSILQAFAAGVPVVGWRWGGAAEIVEEGVTGFLARPFDWEGLAEATRKALAQGPSMKEGLLDAARLYSWDAAASTYATLYREVVAARAAEPRVTVLVTAYNLAKYLPACLDSVLLQEGVSWECVVVDDNSPDDCGRIADEYAAKDPRIRVIHNERNYYLAGARNIGLEAAQGRYVTSLDADDMLTPGALKTLAESLDADPKIHVAYGGVYFVGEDGETPQVYGSRWTPGHSGWPIEFSWELQLRGDAVDADGHRMSCPNCLPYSSMIRTRSAREMGGWRERCRTGEDADFWARLSSYGYTPKKVTENDCLVYRVRTDSMSQTNARVDHSLWFGWRQADLALAPAGVNMGLRPRVPSLEPPAISVIIPVGPGHERIVQQAVDSLEAQTWRGWEVIVVNDTGADLPPLLPSWVRTYRSDNGKPRGVACARNVGARHARARLLFFLDADDFLQPDALGTFFRVYSEELEFDTVYYSDFYQDHEGNGDWKIYESPDWDPGKLLTNGMIGAVSMLVPRHIHNQIGGFREDVSCWEDWSYQIALAAAGVCSRRIAQPLWNYRMTTGKKREEDLGEFERSKAATIASWSQFWDASGTLKQGAKEAITMGCSSCRRPTASTVKGTMQTIQQEQAKSDAAIASGLVAMIYTGPRDASHPYRSAVTKQTYRIASGRWFLAHPQDVDWFLGMRDFSLHTPEAEPAQTEARAPMLR